MSYTTEANEIARQLTQKRLQKESIQQRKSMKSYLPLEQVTKPNLTTDEASYYLDRKPQTLRIWACYKNGPIQPRNINGRSAWSTKEVKELTGVS